MAYRLSILTCCSLLATALAACETDDATRFAEFTEPLLEKYTTLQICMRFCDNCPDLHPEVHSCSQFCNEWLSDVTPTCEDKLALFLLAAYGDLYNGGTCGTAPLGAEFADRKYAELRACMDVHGCDYASTWCEPSHEGGSTACACSKECKAGTVYRTDCPATSSTTVDCNCFVEDVLVGTCQQGFLDRCDQWNGCYHHYSPLLPD